MSKEELLALAERQNGGPLPKAKPWPAHAWWNLERARAHKEEAP